LQYVKSLFSLKPLHYDGHNPLGGWMVFALLASLTGTCWSGLEVYGMERRGPLAQVEMRIVASARANDEETESRRERRRDRSKAKGDELWEEIHETLSNLTLVLVFFHVVGVLIASALHRENLVGAMITGYKIRRPFEPRRRQSFIRRTGRSLKPAAAATNAAIGTSRPL
jgi:cytochrome b